MNRVVNATVISNFAATSQLDLLRNTVGPLYLPLEVYEELAAGRLAGYAYYDDIEVHIEPFAADGWLHLITMSEEELLQSLTLPAHLHSGERACLSIAYARGWGLLTDDRIARKQARDWSIPLSGTLGILLLAVEDQQILLDEGNRLLMEMIERARYRSPTNDLGSLLG